MDIYDVLSKTFGHTSFRGGQEGLIKAILNGRDVFGVMPTGGGKSLCYQVPAVMMDGITLVISPLISLMKDQVMALRNIGIDAAYINSSLSAEQIKTVYNRMNSGKYKLIYIAPERLISDAFVSTIMNLKVSLVAIDEAHCISQWGQDFRPSYLKIVEFLRKLPVKPVLAAFTATATQKVCNDIERILQMEDPFCLITGFDRPNLRLEVQKPNNKLSALRVFVNQKREKSGIIYCSTRNTVEKVCETLSNEGILATRYHAGLSDEERRKNQDDFIYDRRTVMVATNAFGMGIDKSNVGYVIHYNMPQSIEAYYQEAGRAGRDGEKAECVLFFSAGDISTAKFLIQNSNENDELSDEERCFVQQQDLIRLYAIVDYCKTISCLRGTIMEYFSQEHKNHCGNCSNCLSEYIIKDITSEAKMILSCVKRVRDKLGYYVGATLIIRVLKGSAEKRVIDLGLDGLSTFALMKATDRSLIREYIEHLEYVSYLQTNPNHGGIELTEASGDVLFRNEPVLMPMRQERTSSSKRERKSRADEVYSDSENNGLFEVLRALRYDLAKKENIPAYIVFSNANLADMARKAPKTMQDFMSVSGVGEVKAERYGKAFIDAIVEHEQEKINESY